MAIGPLVKEIESIPTVLNPKLKFIYRYAVSSGGGLVLTNMIKYFRLQRLEESLKDEPEEQKSEKRAQHAVKETEFLRLKRSKLGVEDFDPLKVIGRGAFGEVTQYFDTYIIIHVTWSRTKEPSSSHIHSFQMCAVIEFQY
jgi:hypothetical protein